jgi:hypothetical protein
MVKATRTNPYISYNERKTDNKAAVKDNAGKTAPPASSSDLLYSPELSAHMERGGRTHGQNDEPASILDLSLAAQERLFEKKDLESRGAEAAGAQGDPKPPDETRRLTRRLVAAKSTEEVQSVLADTFHSMRQWMKLAAEGDKEAMAVVRRLNRLVSRGSRKIRDLNKEMVMRQRKEKAEKAEKEQLAIRLREELKEAERVRKQRERRYLQERDDHTDDESDEFGPSMVATEAKIRALAAAMVALSPSSPSTVDVGLGDSVASDAGGLENSEVSGGDTPSV